MFVNNATLFALNLALLKNTPKEILNSPRVFSITPKVLPLTPSLLTVALLPAVGLTLP